MRSPIALSQDADGAKNTRFQRAVPREREVLKFFDFFVANKKFAATEDVGSCLIRIYGHIIAILERCKQLLQKIPKERKKRALF